MKITYTVHSISEEEVPVTVEFQGRQVDAKVLGLTVELVSDTYTHTFRFTNPDEVAEARDWAVGDKVVLEGGFTEIEED